MKNSTFTFITFCAIAVQILIWLAVGGLVVFIAHHFIAKYW